jgi:hypothetical protein
MLREFILIMELPQLLVSNGNRSYYSPATPSAINHVTTMLPGSHFSFVHHG